MQLPIEITIQGIGPSPAVEQTIRERAEKLNQYSPRIMRCQVWLNAPHRHHRKGQLYDLRLRLTVPGEELLVDHQPERDDVYVAIRDSFDAARRQLEDYERKWSGRVKQHEALPKATVAKLFRDEGYGYLSTPEGREIYFHRNSLRDCAFEGLRKGSAVKFTEEEGIEGPQAAAVWEIEAATSLPAP